MKLPVEQLYHQVHMTYLRCLSCCYYCPDVWLDFAAFEAKFDWKRATGVVEAALRAIDALTPQGYRFVTLEELFRQKGVEPEPGKLYIRPDELKRIV